MTFREVILAIDGLRNRDRMMEGWIRRATFIIGSTNFGGKALSGRLERLWPIEQPGKGNVSDRAKEQLRIFREAEALQRAQDKLKENG